MSVPQSPAAANLQTLFQYTRWINARMLDAMQAAEAVPARAVKLSSYLLRVQDVWVGRMKSMARWQSMLDERPDNTPDQPTVYTNSEGTRFETLLWDLYRHAMNHGTHHRVQIALVFREADIAPPPTGHIFFARNA